MNKKIKTLSLKKETVRVLRDSEMKSVAGGTSDLPPWWSARTAGDCRGGTTIGCYCTQICAGC